MSDDWKWACSKILSETNNRENALKMFILNLFGLTKVDEEPIYKKVKNIPLINGYFKVIKFWANIPQSRSTNENERNSSYICEVLVAMGWNDAVGKIREFQIKQDLRNLKVSNVPNLNVNNDAQQFESNDREILGEQFQSSSSHQIKPERNNFTEAGQLSPIRVEGKYTTESPLKGRVLILNFIKFKINGVKNRPGSEMDGSKLIEMFQAFNFAVTYEPNATVEELLNKNYGIISQFIKSFDKYKEGPLKTPSCFIVISTHGLKNGELAANDDFFNLKMILEKLVHFSAPNLKHVPKIIIVNACRGPSMADLDLKFEAKYDYKGQPVEYKIVHDLLIAYSTLEDLTSMRDPRKGSLFIQEFVEAATNNRGWDIQRILTHVTEVVIGKANLLAPSEPQIPETQVIGFRGQFFFE